MLPENFRFTQSNLQDFVDCERRFQLKHLEQRVWPAVEAEPWLARERRLELGARFHRLVERHQLGVPVEALSRLVENEPELTEWWRAYLDYDELHALAGNRYPEYVLSAELEGHRVLAKYDLLVVQPGERLVIFDWKTYRRLPGRDQLAARIQTSLYKVLAVAAGSALFGSELVPEQVEFVYWSPVGVVQFEYGREAFEQDRVFLVGLMDRVVGLFDWSMVLSENRCQFCEFRSYCSRGVGVGLVDDFGFLELEEFDFLASVGGLGVAGL